ncbi:glycosyltransferase family 9 protein [Nodosilinea sp. FACHB-13]|uniref:glycosyltransferase family 9 protein n=1 Tax=Cyanophyceae TaxID=3028117 RepID=UPI0018F007E9|nr:glycosyltransferase family 9 protein [Nodosilinea sp. FACHB-13]
MTQILFIELLGGLGDVLIALPAIQALTASHPQAHMTVLTFAPGDSLLHHHPQVHRVLRAPAGQARQAVAEALRSPYDLVVTDTTYDGIADLVCQSGAPQTVTNLWRNPPSDQGVSDRMLQILQHEGLITAAAREHRHPRLYPTAEECDRVQAQLRSLRHPRIALYPDAGMAIKQWSPDQFVALGRLLHQRYGASLIVPAGADPKQAQAIVDQLEDATLWPRGSLRDLAALFAQLDCIVAVDTGPARIAAAVGTPTVTLFGPAWQGRYGQPAPHINLQGYSSCPERNIANFTEQACWYSGTCPFVWDTCVNLIAPEQVAGAIDEILGLGNEGARSAEFVLVKGGNDSVNASDRIGSPNLSVQRNFENCSSSQTIPKALGEVGTGGNHVAQRPNLNASPIDMLRVGESSWQNSPPVSLPNPHPLPFSPWLNARNLLVLRLDNIGDVLMTAPALQAIKETSPYTRLTLMASPAGAMAGPLLPWVDDVLPWRVLWQALGQPPGDVEQDWALIDTLKSRQFDGAIIFTSFKQSPHPAALICQIAGIPLRLGASQETGECLTQRIADLPSDLHQVERNLRLVETAGFEVQNRHLSIAIPPSARVPAVPYLLLNPWASCPSRMYDLERFAIAARTLADKTGWPVVVTGTAKDRAAAASLLDTLGPHAIDLIGQTSLEDLVALVAQARLLLSNNTSTMHIADATQTPSVILFAGTELERQWQPRQTRAQLLRRPTPCSPCYAFTCPYELECLDIAPENVVAAGLALLNLDV